MMRAVLPMLFAFGLLQSCQSSDSKNEEKLLDNEIVKTQIAYANDTLYKGDTLRIKFRVPHWRDLAIISPAGAFYFLVYSHSDSTKPSLVEWNAFANMDYLEIITDRAKANPWNAAAKSNQLIFTVSGTYEINISENLETDDGTAVEVRSVYYYDKPRSE